MVSPPLSPEPTVLAVAGSDPSGGAGIQADLKTMTAIGVYGAAAITCITVQNSLGVTESVPLDAGLVIRQVEAVMADHQVTHVKIGMTGILDIVAALGQYLAGYSGEVVFDPVMASTTGHPLFDGSNPEEFGQLIRQTTVLTPNCSELAHLVGQKITTRSEALACASRLLAMYGNLRAVIVKGGHLEEEQPEICDYLVERGRTVVTSRRGRVSSSNRHGTGCTYASAFTAFHCLKHDYQQAFFLAGTYMDAIIRNSATVLLVNSGTNGPLCHARSLPETGRRQ